MIVLDIAAVEKMGQKETERQSAVYANDQKPCYTRFFVNSRPPTGLAVPRGIYKYICQQLRGDKTTYFATMFDESAGIPVFSAYVVTSEQFCYWDQE